MTWCNGVAFRNSIHEQRLPPAETPLVACDGRRWRHPGRGRRPGVGLVRLGAGENRVIEHQQVQALFPVDLVDGREEHATRVDAH